MARWKRLCMGMIACAGIANPGWSQAPAVPAAPAAPAAAAAAPQGHTLWSFLGINHEKCEKCKDHFCRSQLGNLVNNAGAGATAITGGIIPPICPPGPSKEDLLKPPTSAEGAAAAIQKSEAEAKARRAALRYLGTVDCRYWPEAKAALLAGLRTDPNECVRWEAALSLRNGCCCSKEVIEALTICVNGTEKDGNPGEKSERVRCAAMEALSLCLCSYEAPQDPKEPEKKDPDGREKPDGREALRYYQKLQDVPQQRVVSDARSAVQAHQSSLQRGDRSLVGLITSSIGTHGESEREPRPVAPVSAPVGHSVPAQATAARPMGTPPSQPISVPAPIPARAHDPLAAAVSRVDHAMAVSQPRAQVAHPSALSNAQLTAGAPAPTAQPIVQASTQSAAPRQAGLSTPQALALLREPTFPINRVWAAESLQHADPTTHAQVIPALVQAARTDEVPAVRSACVRSLVQLSPRNGDVMNTLRTLQADPDNGVRQEAQNALRQLGHRP
jgi:hypothetical protein